jgi:hypothetical protein
MVLLLLSVCGHKGFPAITLALVDRSSEFLMQKTWPPHAILVSEWPIYKKYPSPSETTVPIGTKLYRNDVYNVLYKIFSFHFDRRKKCVRHMQFL